jgi:PAS domain S-box-containing protein
MRIDGRRRLRGVLTWFRADQKRWWGPGEVAIIFSGLLLALLIMGITGQSLTTFRRDVPLAHLTQQIQLSILRAQIGTFEVLGDDDRARAETDVYPNLAQAGASCVELLRTAQPGVDSQAPLTDAARRETATSLCQDVQTFTTMTRTLLSDPAANGEGTPFDGRLDGLFQGIVAQTEELSQSLDVAIADDADDLRRLGVGMATVVFILSFAVALAGSRHRRILLVQTQQLANFATLVRSSADAILTLSVEGEITSWNPAAESLFGHWTEEIMGAQAWFLVPPEGRKAFAEMWLPVSRGERTTHYEGIGVRNGGSQVPIALTLSPLFESEVVVGVSVICRDMTERRAKDLELATARNEALESSRLKSQFLATMSHEIRTPMNGVLGLNALLLQTSLNDMQRQYAEGVESAGVALLTVINDILDFSKLEAGKVEFDVMGFDPRTPRTWSCWRTAVRRCRPDSPVTPDGSGRCS